MSNFNKAFEVCLSLEMDDGDMPSAMDYVRALRDAGLLAPELPEPGNNHSPSWGVVHFDKKNQVIKIGINGVFARSPKVAREWAHGLLAAANYAEKERGNE